MTVNKLRRIGRLAILVAAVIGIAAIYWYRGVDGPETGRAATGRPAVPVTAVVAARRDVPVYLTGLGTVQATLSVGIHSLVDGKLQEVRFTEGQRVKNGDILAKIDPRPYKAALDQAKAKKAQDEAQLVAADKDLSRFKALALKSVQTEQNVDLQQAKVDQLKAAIEGDEAAIEAAQIQLDHTDITAPNDGRVGIRLIDPGNTIHATDTGAIVNLVLSQPAAVVFTLPAQMLDDVRRAQDRGTVEVTAFDQDNRVPLSVGQLLLVDNAIDPATATIRLKAIFANEDERLWPGEFVNARLLLETRSNVVAVPAAAIQRGPQGLFAWIATAEDTAAARPLKVGATTGDLTIITSGLNEGDRVITEGQYKLQARTPVTVSAPATATTARSAM
ncbi:MAG TPA: efflux RND transporter periplasmic adaptor subunit [Xanthobacteraceae bacterium]